MPSSTSSSTYLDVLRTPRVLAVFASAVIGRMAYPFVSLPLLFAIEESAGSYAAAGTATGLYGATAAFLAPLRSRAIDRYGARRVLPAFASAFALCLVTLAGATAQGAGTYECAGLAGLTGAFAPPLGPVMRVVWSTLMPTRTDLKKALSLDAVVEELLYLVGPALAGILLMVASPSILLIVPALLVMVGTVSMAAAPETGAAYRRPRLSTADPRPAARLASRALVVLLLPVLAAGLLIGTIYVAIPASVGGVESGNDAGVLLAVFACGSAVGGLAYGGSTLRASPRIQLCVLTTLLSAGTLAASQVVSPFGLGAMLAMTGLFLSPIMIVAYLAASSVTMPGRSTEAITWVNTSHNAGASAGTFMAGFAIDSLSASGALVVAATVALCLVGVSAGAPVKSRRTWRR